MKPDHPIIPATLDQLPHLRQELAHRGDHTSAVYCGLAPAKHFGWHAIWGYLTEDGQTGEQYTSWHVTKTRAIAAALDNADDLHSIRQAVIRAELRGC